MLYNNAPMIGEHDQKTKWYIKLSDGTMKGPFSSSDAAETVKLNEHIAGEVVAGTADGKQLLFEG